MAPWTIYSQVAVRRYVVWRSECWHYVRGLTQELTEESLWFDPSGTVQWLCQQKLTQWEVSGSLSDNFERGEQAGRFPLI